jgi:hypothetical protein
MHKHTERSLKNAISLKTIEKLPGNLLIKEIKKVMNKDSSVEILRRMHTKGIEILRRITDTSTVWRSYWRFNVLL